jgi:hypothetical protein
VSAERSANFLIVHVCETGVMREREGANEGRAPICPACGVTALPAELANVLDPAFVCDNADCEAYGEHVGLE